MKSVFICYGKNKNEKAEKTISALQAVIFNGTLMNY